MNHQNKEEMIMSSEDFVDALSLSKNLEAEEAFKSAMQDKIGAALETKRREVANTFVKTVVKDNGDVEEVLFILCSSNGER